MWTYSATVIRLIDGDTIEIVIDLGFDLKIRQTVRMYGINAPEMNTQAGKDAKVYLASLVGPNSPVIVATAKGHDKYGRYLATVQRPGDTASINDMMLSSGHAVKMGG